METAPDHALLTPLSALGSEILELSAGFAPSFLGQFPVPRHGAVQPSGPPHCTGKRTRPRGAIPPAGGRTVAPKPVASRRPSPAAPRGFALGVPLGEPGGPRQERPCLLACPRPLTPAQRARGRDYTISPVPEVATARVTDASLLQPGTVRKVETR